MIWLWSLPLPACSFLETISSWNIELIRVPGKALTDPGVGKFKCSVFGSGWVSLQPFPRDGVVSQAVIGLLGGEKVRFENKGFQNKHDDVSTTSKRFQSQQALHFLSWCFLLFFFLYTRSKQPCLFPTQSSLALQEASLPSSFLCACPEPGNLALCSQGSLFLLI